MILADFECPSGHVHECFVHSKQKKVKCHTCGKTSRKIISQGKKNLMSDENTAWVKQSADALLDRDTAHLSDKAHVRELAMNPTRTNLRNYIKAEGIRHAENEGGAPPVYRKPQGMSTEQKAKILFQRHMDRKRLEINS